MKRDTISLISSIGFVVIFCFAANGAGELDPAFNPALIQMEYRSSAVNRTDVRRVVRQPDGKMLIAGFFSVVGKIGRSTIARLNADGTVDATFMAPIMLNEINTPARIYAVALQADGKILIGGNFVTVAGVDRPGIARLNSDGSVDPTFASAASYNFNTGYVIDIEVGADGKITFGGNFIYNPPQNQRFSLARVFADGTLDSSLDPQSLTANPSYVGDILLLPADKMMLFIGNPVGQSGGAVYRVNANGSVDFAQPVGGQVERFAAQADGKILVGGSFNSFNGFPITTGLVRLNTDGSFDTFFTPPNINSISDIELLSGGKILAGGGFTTGTSSYVILLNPDGTVDNSLNYTGVPLFISDLGVQLDGKILIGGSALESGGVIRPPLVRLTATGATDAPQILLGNSGRANKIFVQPDGKILVAGFFTHADGALRGSIARLNADGTFDGSFTPPAFAGFEYFGLDLQSDGVILAASFNGFRKLNPNGTHLFTSVAGASYDIKSLPDGRLLVGLNNFLRLVNTNNTFDFSFNVPTNGLIRRFIRQPDGKIIIAGYFTHINSIARGRIARLNADGTLDNSYNPNSGANNTITDMALQPDGKIIITGPFTGVNFNSNYKFAARLNTDATLDTGFNPIVNGEVTSLKLQPDGRILIGGNFTTVNGIPRNSMARLNADGSLDPSFNLGLGTDYAIRTIELQAGNKILIGGEFTRVNGVDRLGFARLSNDLVLRTAFDFDGDGKADVSVFRPSENQWYVLRSSDSAVTQQVFAIAGDVPVPADYDGDGKTDIAIFRPSNGDWWSLSSLNGNYVNAHWGEAGVIPRPSDFDGDGKSDYIFFQPANSTWYRFGSSAGASSVTFGISGDKPVTGDFDGDGKTDVAIFRPSTGDWWWQSSIDNGQRANHWGISTDIPAPADYDGDGKTDFAVYRPSTGAWYIFNSSGAPATIMSFGIAEDKPVPADYDGDGKADIAVFRPSNGAWYLLRSRDGFFALSFGISTDIPVEGAFVP